VKLIVGLGNPGIRYAWTRHNIGFQVVDQLADTDRILLAIKRFNLLYGRGSIDSQQVLLAKPMTFMNRSGEAVREAAHFFRIETEELIVVHDDMDLPFGKIRFKRRGGDGGHQGVRSIIECMGGGLFARVKIGVGRPPKEMDPADYILTSFSRSERLLLKEIIPTVAEALRVLILEGIETAMNRYQKNHGIQA
jgi:peptidyl-tRNA hydrolase, PTH1 family